MKLRNLFIALLMTIGTTLMAQEKYEQAIVTQVCGWGSGLTVSIEGQSYKRERPKDLCNDNFDFSPLLKQIAEMRNDGWEVWNSSTTSFTNQQSPCVIYFLRRKLK